MQGELAHRQFVATRECRKCSGSEKKTCKQPYSPRMHAGIHRVVAVAADWILYARRVGIGFAPSGRLA